MPGPAFRFAPKNRRRILCVFPEYAWSFGTFNYAFPLFGRVKAFMPPQGILLIAALLPPEWEVVLVDENVRPAREDEFVRADVVFASGMHMQREQIRDVILRSHAAGKPVVLGGPSASSMPEWYPEADIIHQGEAGDATFELFDMIDRGVERPRRQVVFRTAERLSMTDLPMPAYHLVDVRNYLICTVQYSSGCPHSCDFCDIPSLYGRRPRHKDPDRIVRELDNLASAGANSVYFVDDNFIGDPDAARELLDRLATWQDKWDTAVRLSCEATLELAEHPDILSRMRDAFFTNVFCGVESPETRALQGMGKSVNLRRPILESFETINRYGLEIATGLIMGFDTDTDRTPRAIADFIHASRAPLNTLNILYALPGSTLYRRMKEAGRIVDSENRESNIKFLQPCEQLIESWRCVIAEVYKPSALYGRYAAQAEMTYPNRRRPRYPIRRATPRNIHRALRILTRLIWRAGVQADYRAEFWSMFRSQLRQGNIENIFQIATTACHLISYARDCAAGRANASNFACHARPRRAKS